jgi:hypothetical protein
VNTVDKNTTWQPFYLFPFFFFYSWLLLWWMKFILNMDDLWMNTSPWPPSFVWTDGPTYTTDGQVPCFAPFHVLLALPLRVLRKKSSGLKVCHTFFFGYFFGF